MSPYVALGSLGAALAVALGGYAYGHHVEALAFARYREQQAAVAEKAAADSQAKARAAEQAADQKLVAVSASYQEQVNALSKTRDSLTAAVSAGTQRLFVHVAGPGATGVSGASSGSARGNATATAQLASDTANDLIALAIRADDITDQLTAAQAVIVQDRVTCNGSAP